jgi:ketosteroid isomerase-like protein
MMFHTVMRTLLLSLILCSAAFAASPDEQQVLDAEKAWISAVLAKDFAKLDTILMPDLIYAHSTGNIEDKAKYVGNMKSGTQRYAGIETETPSVRMHGNAALTHTIVRMHGTNAAGPFDNRVMMMHMWVKSGGKWKLAGHQTTMLPK